MNKLQHLLNTVAYKTYLRLTYLPKILSLQTETG